MTESERIAALEQEVAILALCVQAVLDATSKGPSTLAETPQQIMNHVARKSAGRQTATQLAQVVLDRLAARGVNT